MLSGCAPLGLLGPSRSCLIESRRRTWGPCGTRPRYLLERDALVGQLGMPDLSDRRRVIRARERMVDIEDDSARDAVNESAILLVSTAIRNF